MNCPNCKTDFKFNESKPIVVLGVPMLDSTMHYTIMQQWDFLLKNYRTISCIQESTYVDMARNNIVSEGFKRSRQLYGVEPDYFLLVDSDSVIGERDKTGSGNVIPRPDYINRLMERNVDAISGWYVKKADPYAQKPVWGIGNTKSYPPLELDKSGLQEVDWFGGGYLLVKSQVFSKIEGPWFENRNDGFGKKGGRLVGEDIFFCELLKKNGYKLFVDLTVKIGHHGGVAWPPED